MGTYCFPFIKNSSCQNFGFWRGTTRHPVDTGASRCRWYRYRIALPRLFAVNLALLSGIPIHVADAITTEPRNLTIHRSLLPHSSSVRISMDPIQHFKIRSRRYRRHPRPRGAMRKRIRSTFFTFWRRTEQILRRRRTIRHRARQQGLKFFHPVQTEFIHPRRLPSKLHVPSVTSSSLDRFT